MEELVIKYLLETAWESGKSGNYSQVVLIGIMVAMFIRLGKTNKKLDKIEDNQKRQNDLLKKINKDVDENTAHRVKSHAGN